MLTNNKNLVFEIRSSTAHKFSSDKVATFLSATTTNKSWNATPSMLLGTFLHSLLLGDGPKHFEVVEKSTAKIKEFEDRYEIKMDFFNYYTKQISLIRNKISSNVLLLEIMGKGVKERTFNVTKEEYLNTMGLILNMEACVQGTPDVYYIKDDTLYILDFKTSSNISQISWLSHSKRYGYLHQFAHYKTLIEISEGRKFDKFKFIHLAMCTKFPSNGVPEEDHVLSNAYYIFDDEVSINAIKQLEVDTAYMCDALNQYGENFAIDYGRDFIELGYSKHVNQNELDEEEISEEEEEELLMGAI